jgi:hypothetical protein
VTLLQKTASELLLSLKSLLEPYGTANEFRKRRPSHRGQN